MMRKCKVCVSAVEWIELFFKHKFGLKVRQGMKVRSGITDHLFHAPCICDKLFFWMRIVLPIVMYLMGVHPDVR